MLDRLDASIQLHCRRCGTPLDMAAEKGADRMWDCPRCRLAALHSRRASAAQEDEIVNWLLALDVD